MSGEIVPPESCIRCGLPTEAPFSRASACVNGKNHDGPLCEDCRRLYAGFSKEFWNGPWPNGVEPEEDHE